MSNETIPISVGWRFDESDIDSREERVTMAKNVLDRNGCRVLEITDTTNERGVTTTEVIATCPVDVRVLHATFDRPLNKGFPEGAGTGWVLEM